MTREEFEQAINTYCNKNSLFLDRHCSIADPDIREFIWSLMEQHAEDMATELDVNAVLPMPPISKHAVTVDVNYH